MGGVDLMDMFLSLYRIDRRSKRWYVRIIYYLVSISITNAWLLYKRSLEKQSVIDPMSLRDFITCVAESLSKAGKQCGSLKRGRPSLESLLTSKHKKQKTVPLRGCAQPDVRFDGLAHWPIHGGEKKQRCCQ
jgi:hypothetical protein